MLVLCFTFSSVKKTTEESLTNKVRRWRRRNVLSAWLLGMAAFQVQICLFLRGDIVKTSLTNGHLNWKAPRHVPRIAFQLLDTSMTLSFYSAVN